MLRSKGLTDKLLLIGLDGMDPRFTKYMLDSGKMPNTRKLLEMGSAREDLVLLGGVPTITPPMWATLATGAYPMTHGIIDYQLQQHDELDICYGGFYSTSCVAEPLWNVTAKAGKKTLVWHWPGGSWPPTSDNPNLMVVDGTSPGSLGSFALQRDREFLAIATNETEEVKYAFGATASAADLSGKVCDAKHIKILQTTKPLPGIEEHDQAMELAYQENKERGSFQGYEPMRAEVRDDVLDHSSMMGENVVFPCSVSYSPLREPEGWGIPIPSDAKEFTMLMGFGRLTRYCLLVKGESGAYDSVLLYRDKNTSEPLAILKKDVFTTYIYDVCPTMNGTMCKVFRNMRMLEVEDDGSRVLIWVSSAMDCEDKSIWYPQWIYDECVSRFGAPTPTSQIAGGDMNSMMKCCHEQWKMAAKWQADCICHMIDKHDIDVLFSHYHGPDMEGHTYMGFLKNRDNSPTDESIILSRAEATYNLADEYIGRFLPYIDKGYTLIVFSDHGLICPEEKIHPIGDSYGVNAGVLCDLGYTALIKDKDGKNTGSIDWANTRAVQTRSNSIYINLKGRNPHGIVDPADKYELEEQIITDLYGYKDKKTGKRVVTLALHNKDAILLGVGGEFAADIVFFVHDDYNLDHGDSLSTACGHNHTSTSPLFVAAGPGIKANYSIKGYIREVDVAPTAAVLLGVDIPAQCEGAPAYQIFTEAL